ncbi:MAG: ribbon-helix-helix domain-containing protein [Acidobacteriota bacterium]
MSDTFTVSLPPSIRKEFDGLAIGTGKSRNQVVREAVHRQIALEPFRALREQFVPKPRARGIYADEDVFKLVS